MSELESYYYYEDRVITPATHCYRVYHADEADKVITELETRLSTIQSDKMQLEDKNRELRKENEDLKNELYAVKTDLAMSQRWRKYPEEKPDDGQVVWAYEADSNRVLTLEYEKTDEGEGFICFPYKQDSYTGITHWMPYNKPKAPEAK